MKRPLTRKETAPKNLAAKALKEGQFRPKVEENPKAYARRPKHKLPPAGDGESEDTEIRRPQADAPDEV